MVSNVRLIIFDFDGVVVNPMHPDLYKALEKLCGVPWQVINRCSLPLWIKARVAEVDEDEYWRSLGKACRMDASRVKEFSYSFFHRLSGVREIIEELRTRYRVALLSNHLERWFKHIFETTECAGLFDWTFTSFGEHMAKPSKPIYQRVVDVTGVPATECLFIDDITRNVEAAAKFGMRTIRFTNAAALRAELATILAPLEAEPTKR